MTSDASERPRGCRHGSSPVPYPFVRPFAAARAYDRPGSATHLLQLNHPYRADESYKRGSARLSVGTLGRRCLVVAKVGIIRETPPVTPIVGVPPRSPRPSRRIFRSFSKVCALPSAFTCPGSPQK